MGGSVSKAEKKVAIMVAVMIVTFFFAWTPYAVVALVIAFADVKVEPWLGVVPALVAKSSICYNPLIYVGLNTQFRSAWKRLFGARDRGETSLEVGTTASFDRNVSYTVTKDFPSKHSRFSTKVPVTVCVQMDTKDTNQPITIVNKSQEENGAWSVLNHKTPGPREKKRKKRGRPIKVENSVNIDKFELSYMTRDENTL